MTIGVIALALVIVLLLATIFVVFVNVSPDVSEPISTVKWESRSGHNKLQLRGHVFEQDDVKNLLPGGHGNFLN